ncbi:hypothetical protein DXX93_08195 [Thalassotalea euphylliae]|uniref:Uncharacterized protein n=1 Tax=Thalassotalea euphylliae TaxID=1655234 RepID=A0A3E0TRF4_9GAMM|nr:hypothetical protein [Thalassotalea euphylliae]REL26562.1 hypothetical protein DXX93_08195 [Thalassotalea euphylliae]
MKNDLLNFLNDYVEDPKIIPYFELNPSDKDKLPKRWLQILENEDEKIQRALEEWAEFKEELKLVYEYLVENLVSLDLAYFNENYHLIYGLRSGNGKEILYYQSSNPKGVEKQERYRNLTTRFQSFYRFQNGWYY